MNSEIVARLEAKLLPATTLRFRDALANINKTRTAPITISFFAEQLAGEDPEMLNNLFKGKHDGAFKMLDHTAAIIGVNAAWLKHGESPQYPVMCDVKPDLMRQLLFANSTQGLHFICSDAEYPQIAIIRQHDAIRYTTLKSPVVLIEYAFPQPQLELAAFSNLCYALCLRYAPPVHSTTVTDNLFRDLICGRLYGNAALKAGSGSNWVKDFWNPARFRNPHTIATYAGQWPWFQSLCETTYRLVQENEHLRNERDAALEGRFDLASPPPEVSR